MMRVCECWLLLLGAHGILESPLPQGVDYVLGPPGKSCTYTCNQQSPKRCRNDPTFRFKSEKKFAHTLKELEIDCEIQKGGNVYDPSVAKAYCGWMTAKNTKVKVKSYHWPQVSFCDEVPPPQTQRVCPCTGSGEPPIVEYNPVGPFAPKFCNGYTTEDLCPFAPPLESMTAEVNLSQAPRCWQLQLSKTGDLAIPEFTRNTAGEEFPQKPVDGKPQCDYEDVLDGNVDPETCTCPLRLGQEYNFTYCEELANLDFTPKSAAQRQLNVGSYDTLGSCPNGGIGGPNCCSFSENEKTTALKHPTIYLGMGESL
jgi:hypothetical protein